MLRLVPLLVLFTGCLLSEPTDYHVSWSTAVHSTTVSDAEMFTYINAAEEPYRMGYEGSMTLTAASGHAETTVCAQLVRVYTTVEEQFGHDVEVENVEHMSMEQCKVVQLDVEEPAVQLALVTTR